MFTLEILQQMFPRKSGTCATIGYIPMSFFVENEQEIRQVTQKHGLRSIYRGPRLSKGSTTTTRGIAYAVTFYRK